MLLGREVQDYLFREFNVFEYTVVDEDEVDGFLSDEGVNVILPLDMPLVRVKDISEAIDSMRRKKIDSMSLGSKRANTRICFGTEEKSSFFVTGNAFLRLGGAKNYSIVYNCMRERIIDRHLSKNVRILDTHTTHIDDTVTIAKRAVIQPFCRLIGTTVIKDRAEIYSSYIQNSVIEKGAFVQNSHIVNSRVGNNTTVGPFARLRGALIGEECRIGDFVEVKASKLEKGVKSAHLCYIGDAEVGEETNVGCGTVFCNYDGKNKHKSKVGKDCFIGANANLIAPITIGNEVFIAAGTTVNHDLEDKTFAIGRVRHETKKK